MTRREGERARGQEGGTSNLLKTRSLPLSPIPPLALSLLLLFAAPATAQPDTTAAPSPVAESTREVSPGTALRRSLVVPGWGQVYNRDYVKAVIAVAGVGALVTLAVVNNNRTVRYRRAAIYEDCLNRPTTVPPGTCDGYTRFEDEWNAAGQPPASVSRALRDASRRNRDFSILLSALAYALQALDAYVSAHLADFDVSEDLSIHVVPTPTGAAATVRWSF